jgi:hypothetical protein
MERYVGLDVSLKQTAICVVNQAGSIVQEGVVDSDPEAIAGFMRSKAPGAVRIGIETGPTTTWLWTELKRLGLPVICIDARHPPPFVSGIFAEKFCEASHKICEASLPRAGAASLGPPLTHVVRPKCEASRQRPEAARSMLAHGRPRRGASR